MFGFSKKEAVVSFIVLSILLLAAYLPFINKNGYLQDDWQTLYVTEQRGAGSIVDRYSIDRPLRGYFSLAEYRIFGTSMTSYQIAALTFRFLDAAVVLLILMLVWPKNWAINLFICSLIILFPGFHEQTHALDYQAQLVSRLCMVTSIYLSLLAVPARHSVHKLLLVSLALLLAQVSFGLMEYYIGLEGLRIALLYVFYKNRKNVLSRRLFNGILVVFVLNASLFLFWRLFIFSTRRASVDTTSMFAGYQSFLPKLLSNVEELAVNFYRLVISAFYKPLTVFINYLDNRSLVIGVVLSITVSVLVIFLISRRRYDLSTSKDSNSFNPWVLIFVGLFGAICALIPIIFGGRQIIYDISGDRFSYPGSISACLIIVGIIALLRRDIIKNFFLFVLIAISLLTQFSNDYIFKLNYIETNATWWQLSWRAPQLEPRTLITGNIDFGMNSEDYTFWGPANIIYYPHDKDIQITAEVLNSDTLAKIQNGVQDLYTRGTATFDRDFRNLLVITKYQNSCVHVIDGKHPEFSKTDSQLIQDSGLFSDLSRIDGKSSNIPIPRSDLFGPQPERGWCYYFEKAQLERQNRNWENVAKLGEQAINSGLKPSDSMEWLVFLQGFSYTNLPLFDEVLKAVKGDSYSSSQACQVYDAYTVEMNDTGFKNGHGKLLAAVCN